MATPVREFSYGAVEIYSKKTLGIGSYGKVCKAKCGQLPCAAKLLHDTMFGTNDPGISKFVERFEQECQFLRAIKHPNIVQFLGTLRDPRSRSTGSPDGADGRESDQIPRAVHWSPPLPHPAQHLPWCSTCPGLPALQWHHPQRPVQQQHVLLIGEGSRAKVTDFGMSKLVGMNPRMTPLTMCPGTAAYMPPEALITPPRYSSKLDCFSHGVLTIQITTRQFPNPWTDATTTMRDPRYPTGLIHVQVPEIWTSQEGHRLGRAQPPPPTPCTSLSQISSDRDRPSADELCGRLATLKCEPQYTHSVEQSREQNMSLQTATRNSKSQIQPWDRASWLSCYISATTSGERWWIGES